MSAQPVIAAFDFDGTITTRDTFAMFIAFVKGRKAMLWGFLRHAHLLVAWKLGRKSNEEVKQKIFTYFFAGMSLDIFNDYCKAFFNKCYDIIRPEAMKAIVEHRRAGNTLVIVSASVENWVQVFADHLGIDVVLCTTLAVDENNRLTGTFASPNCYGNEKVKRLIDIYPDRSEYRLIAYGDSKGDKALLAFADEAYFRSFEKKIDN
jgi:HAD superfamily hydrolase (TIGR01490 family)